MPFISLFSVQALGGDNRRGRGCKLSIEARIDELTFKKKVIQIIHTEATAVCPKTTFTFLEKKKKVNLFLFQKKQIEGKAFVHYTKMNTPKKV